MVKSTQTITAPWNDDYPYQARAITHSTSPFHLSLLHPFPKDRQSDHTNFCLLPNIQKFTAFPPRLDLLAVGTTDIDGTQSTVTLLTYPGMDFVWKWESTDSKIDGELVDIDFGADGSSVSGAERAD
jgi:hypothetical protein